MLYTFELSKKYAILWVFFEYPLLGVEIAYLPFLELPI